MDHKGAGVEEAEEIEPLRGSESYQGYINLCHSSGIPIDAYCCTLDCLQDFRFKLLIKKHNLALELKIRKISCKA